MSNILKTLEEMVKKNQKMVMEAVEKIDSLYERLQMEMNEKFQFLAENQVRLQIFSLPSFHFRSLGPQPFGNKSSSR